MQINLNKLRNRGFHVDVNEDEITIHAEHGIKLRGLPGMMQDIDFSSNFDRETTVKKIGELIATEQLKSILFTQGE